MASRFASSSLHQRDPRSDLFRGYTGGDHRRGPPNSAGSPSPYGGGGGGGRGYGYPGGGGAAANGAAAAESSGGLGGFRAATPNSRGQYSNAVLDELESQNDSQVEGILGKVKILKDMTMAMGEEIRDSSALAEKMNNSFDRTRLRLRGTMNRMLLMAERTGVGWKVWLGFFAFVVLLFMYVWLF